MRAGINALILAAATLCAAVPAASARTEWLQANGVSLRYELTGTHRSTVVLLHEMTLTQESWDDIVPALAREHRVLRYDLRGFGLSSRLNGNAITMDEEVEDLRALLDGLGIKEPVTLIGGAVGANIALVFAATYPQRVKAVATFSAAITLGKPPGEVPAPIPAPQAKTNGVDPLEGVYPAILRTDAARFERFKSIQAAADPAAIEATNRMLAAVDYAAVLPKVQAPTLVVATSLYKRRTPQMMQAIADALPRGRFEAMPTGHFAAMESPQLVIDSLRKFLGEAQR